MKQEADAKGRAVVLAMLDLKRTTKGAATAVVGDWLVRRAKEMWPRFAGLSGFRRTNVAYHYLVLSYHHPAQLCWSWGWSISFNRRDVRWRPIWLWFRPFRYHSAGLTIPFLFNITYNRQPYDWMLSSAGEQRLRHFALKGGEHG